MKTKLEQYIKLSYSIEVVPANLQRDFPVIWLIIQNCQGV